MKGGTSTKKVVIAGHFIMICPLEGHLRGHFIMFYLSGGVYCHTLLSKGGSREGRKKICLLNERP